MLYAQKGHFQSGGHFVPDSLSAKIPVNQLVTIIWEEDAKEAEKNKKLTQLQREAAQNFLAAMHKIRKELTMGDEDAINELQSGKYKPTFENRSAEL